MVEPRGNAEQLSRDFGEGAAATVERAAESAAAVAERASEATARQAERVATESRKGLQQATQTAETGAKAALRSGVTFADGVREITQAWADYAEEVMHHSSQAGQALLRCHSWTEILEVQAQLLRGGMHAFLDQSTKVAEIGSRMAARPFEALAEASGVKLR
jgi:hypothetical protein